MIPPSPRIPERLSPKEGGYSSMTSPKNPRITITPKAYQALCIQAALEMLPPGTLASRVILSYHSEEANQALLAAAWREALPHKEPQKGISERKALKEAKPKLSQNTQALAKIKKLWSQTPRPSISEIAKEIDYPKATVADNIKRRAKTGELSS
jgi:hypothetical protein